ncbi:hypothetical protein DSO57_1029052 [Entomophthora muscae]|uniref:Uncharacterized protein n=1 Tax=Entomophthora muscae TaxID=34485 RepID=A0ACC2T1F1_9FUNG|nr:hypothetical protein DSO57_1029052 [Entomophthora muscae]
MKLQDARESFERLVFTKYDKLEYHERLFVQTYFKVFRTFVETVHVLGLVTFPLMVMFVTKWEWLHYIVAVWSLGEIAFYINHYRMLPKLKVRRQLKTSIETRSYVVKGLLENMGDPAASRNELLKNWVLEGEDMNEGHLVQWILLLMYGKSAEHMTESELPHAKKIIEEYRDWFNLPPADGKSPTRVYSPGLDKVNVIHKPLLYYQVLAAFRLASAAYFTLRGFRFSSSKTKHPYWVRYGNPKLVPLVFIAGVGVGFMAYINFISGLIDAYPGRTIVLLEVPYVSMQPAAEIASMDDALEDVDRMFAATGLGPCSWLSHSYGSVLHSWVVNHRRHLVKRSTFVDPISFRTWDGSLLRFFIYDKPDSMCAEAVRYFMAQDPTIGHAVSIHTFWLLNVLFPECLTMPCHIFYSTKDTLFDVQGCIAHIRHRVATTGQKNVILKTMDTNHGGFQLYPKYVNEIIGAV